MAHVRKYRDACEGCVRQCLGDKTVVANTLHVMIAGRHERWSIWFQSKRAREAEFSLRYHSREACVRRWKGDRAIEGFYREFKEFWVLCWLSGVGFPTLRT